MCSRFFPPREVVMGDYRDHPEFAALLAAVRANPHDDLPRLVLADWLEEKGEAERAEFIRVQCELAKFPRPNPPEAWGQLKSWQRRRLVELQERERELLGTAYREWSGVMRDVVPKGGHFPSYMTFARGFLHTVRAPLAVLAGGECGAEDCDIGEVGEYERCPTTGDDVWMGGHPCPQCHGTGRTAGILPELVRSNPVERVEVTDREPSFMTLGTMFRWTDAGNPRQLYSDRTHPHNQLPTDLFRLVKGNRSVPNQSPHIKWFHSADDAKYALSAALLAWAASPSEVQA